MKNYGSSYSYGSTTNKVNYPATNSSQLQTHIPQTNEHTNLSNFHSSSNYNSSTSLNRSLGDAVKRPASYHNRV
jgi:hypothetical protein